MSTYSDRAELFTDVILDELAARNVSIKDFADNLNISSEHLNDILNNKATPSPELLETMSILHDLSREFYGHLWRQTHEQ